MAWWRGRMFGRMSVVVPVHALSGLGIVLALAATPAPAMQLSEGLSQLYASVSINPPSEDRITVCYGFVCRRRYVLDFTPADQKRLTEDRKSTRLNSSHLGISYAVFCLKK